MNIEPLPAWLQPVWRKLLERRERMPHALLLCGAPGSGKRLFAEHFARAMLCRAPGTDGFACGSCPACMWIASGNHPDNFVLVPAADEANEDEADSAESGRKEKAKSSQILIDQVRALQGALEVGAGGHDGGRRTVIVDPAEAMNHAAANSLLKALEEPLESTHYVLVSHAPGRLLPTIRSRCQVIDFPRPDTAQALAWLRSQGLKDDALLGFASGLPIAARDYARSDLRLIRQQLAKELAVVSTIDPLKLAGDWEARLKLKASVEAGFTMVTLIGWIQRWIHDGIRVANGLAPRFFEDFRAELKTASRDKAAQWLECSKLLNEFRKTAQHPLNARLFLEDLALNLRRSL